MKKRMISVWMSWSDYFNPEAYARRIREAQEQRQKERVAQLLRDEPEAVRLEQQYASKTGVFKHLGAAPTQVAESARRKKV